MTDTLDATDRCLLNMVQREFPLVGRPYDVYAKILRLAEQEVLDRVRRLKEDLGIIRQIGAIFDSRRLGYKSMLVAMKVNASRVDEAAEVLNGHPGISHNYLRENPYNLWFTIAVHRSRDIRQEVADLQRKIDVRECLMLPTLRLFKIGVALDMGEEIGAVRGHGGAGLEHDQVSSDLPTDDDVRAIRVLQQDLRITLTPYEDWAQDLVCSVEELLAKARSLKERRLMRRFSAVLRHRAAGYDANSMVVWVVPEERIESAGATMATYQAVSHCYQRPTFPDWPYSVFTMIHGRSRDACQQVVEMISEETGLDECAVLWSTKEYKKSRVRYFAEESV